MQRRDDFNRARLVVLSAPHASSHTPMNLWPRTQSNALVYFRLENLNRMSAHRYLLPSCPRNELEACVYRRATTSLSTQETRA